jgi:hypothetical protein
MPFFYILLTPGGPMWRFSKRRRVIKKGDFSPRYEDNSDEVSEEEQQASDKFHCTSVTDAKNGPSLRRKLRINRLYMDCRFKLSYSIATRLWQILTNSAMATAILKRNLTTVHSQLTSKRAAYFNWNLKTEKL